ncbi:hypothetical protein EYR38_005015 [Pleurotus pulmonarius]|nr:hypothetical protein EYR38_005015 [Pleurotus pulmonarius]
MPPWVPAGLKEVVLGGSIMSALPNFGQTIRPSVVRISLFGSRPYINHFTWFKDCIGRLPFPNLIQVFEIRIYIGIPTPVNNFLPATSDYEMMSQSLQPLWRAGGVKNIAVNITVTFDGEPDVVPDLARESAKLKAGFARLLPANVSDMRECDHLSNYPPLEATRLIITNKPMVYHHFNREQDAIPSFQKRAAAV